MSRIDRRTFVRCGIGTAAGITGTVSARGGSNVRTPRTIEIEGTPSGRTYYQFGTLGRLSARSTGRSSAEDVVLHGLGSSTNRAYGFVRGGTDRYESWDEATVDYLNVNGNPRVYFDGRRVDPDRFRDTPSVSGNLSNTIAIRGSDSSRTYYQFDVTGGLGYRRGTAGGEDVILDNTYQTARGFVRGGTDTYRFSGRINHFVVNGTVGGVTINGRQVDPASIENEPDGGGHLPSVFTIRGNSSNPTNYQFSVSGSLGHSNDDGASIGGEDVVLDEPGRSHPVGYGFVRADPDSYRFSGEITDFRINGSDADLFVNGRRVADPVGEP